MATVVMNQSDETITYQLFVGSEAIEVIILRHSIQTLVY
jgi:glucosylceramidase